jgi:PAS domain S-box-containing protein
VLFRSKGRLEHLLISSPAVIFSSGAPGNPIITFVSHNIKTLLGYEPDEFTAREDFWIDNIYPEDITYVHNKLACFEDRDFCLYEYRFQHKNGGYRWIRDESRLIRDVDGKPLEIVGSWIDITDRKRVEMELLRAHADLERRVDNRTAALTEANRLLEQEIAERTRVEEELRTAHDILDMRVRERTSELAQSNAKLQSLNLALTGLSECNQAVVRARNESELLERICRIMVEIGRNSFAWVGYTDQDKVGAIIPVAGYGTGEDYSDLVNAGRTFRENEPIGLALKSGEPVYAPADWQACFRTDGGAISRAVFPLKEEALSFGVLVIYSEEPDAFNPEARKLLEELADDLAYGIVSLRTRQECDRRADVLLEKEHYFRSLLYNLHEDILVIDRDSKVTDVNREYPISINITREEIIGRHCRQVHGCGQACVKDGDGCILHKVFTTGQAQNIRHEQLREGSRKWVDVFFSPLKDDRGNVTHVIQAIRDITQEATLRMQLRQAQKMEAIGTLAGGIAHDFNNILAIIFGYADLASSELGKEHPSYNRLQNILKAGNRAKDLIKQILAFSRRREYEKSPIQLRPIVKECLALLKAALPASIEIRQFLDVLPGYDTVLADPTQIHQILMNLCTNAGHAMQDEGGVLEVGLSAVEVTKDSPSASGLSAGYYLQISVKDTGRGMEQKTLDRIFEPYFTTKKVGEGTGLGLSVVHGIVKSHGGEITVGSKQGIGTTFRVFLPRFEDCVIQEQRVSAGPMPPMGEGTILLVDDEVLLLNALREILEQLGYLIVAKSSSTEALETFLKDPYKFDLVVTDQTMPQIAGLELSEKILQVRDNIPIILCTGFNALVTSERIEAIGIREVMMKPIESGRLATMVRNLIERSRGKPYAKGIGFDGN